MRTNESDKKRNSYFIHCLNTNAKQNPEDVITSKVLRHYFLCSTMVTDGSPGLTYIDDYRPNNAFIAWPSDKRLYFTLAGARDFGSNGFSGTPEFGMYSNLKNYLELYKYIAQGGLKPTFSATDLSDKLAKVAKVYEQLRDGDYKPSDKEQYYDKNGNKILPF